MKFLKEVLNINVRESECNYSFPNYINSRYRITYAYLDDLKVFFLYAREEIKSVNNLTKHIEKIRQKENIMLVLILEKITARERKKYIKAGIPFVVIGKQCYLPFMGTLLTERCDLRLNDIKKIMPSSQVLLFYFIYHKAEPMHIKDACDNLGFSSMTISRAVKELEKIGLIATHKEGVKKLISSDFEPRELFEKAKPYLSNPIKRKQYILIKDVEADYLISGDGALSMYSMLNPPIIPTYATVDTKILRENKDDIIIDNKNLVELEIWKYKPCLYKEMHIDVLSLIMSYEDNYEARLIKAKEEVLEELWRKLDG